MTMQNRIVKVGESSYGGGDVACSGCRFVFTPVVYETAETGDREGVRVLFDCPDCKKQYVVAHIDRRGLEIRAQLAAIGRQTPKASMGAINERVRVIRRLKAELKKHVHRK